jgi:FtsP/CotA-like multicopper oxidase with cupredoxin domain
MRDFMAHPVHLHGVHFQVLDRQVDDAQRAGWETVSEGLIDQGWKDTVLVMPGERVRIAVRFDGYRGRYLLHCHNLEHEDSGMMRYFEVM